MRTVLRSKITLLFLTIAVLLAVPAIAAIADTLSGDADIDALASPQANSASFNQQPGTTATYNFDSYVRNQGNTNDDVFKDAGDNVKVSVTRGGAWVDQTNGGSPANFTFTQYTINDNDATTPDNTQGGTIRVNVPCDTAAGTKQTMTVTLKGIPADDGPDNVVGTADDVTLPKHSAFGQRRPYALLRHHGTRG